jgi:hypothetical protein
MRLEQFVGVRVRGGAMEMGRRLQYLLVIVSDAEEQLVGPPRSGEPFRHVVPPRVVREPWAYLDTVPR